MAARRHVERLGRETVLSTRLRLDDLDVASVRDAGRCAVSLPTVGRKVTHEVLLHTVEGELLDRSGPYPILERVISPTTFNGPTLRPVVRGITDPPPGLGAKRDLLNDADEYVASAVEALLDPLVPRAAESDAGQWVRWLIDWLRSAHVLAALAQAAVLDDSRPVQLAALFGSDV